MDIKQTYFSNLKGDLTGGLTAGIVALPLALAFGVASGLGAAAGLYGAILVGFFAAVFGGTPSQVSGPTGPMTVVVAGIVAAQTGNPTIVFAAVALAGVLQIGLGLLRVGDYIKFIPYPVISGFMSGIGVIIVAQQLSPFLGHAPQAKIIHAIFTLPATVMKANLAAAGLGVLAIAMVYLGPKFLKGVPGPLIAIVAGTIAALLLKLDVPKIGQLPQGLPSLQLPPLTEATLIAILTPALVLAVLGAIDSLLTSLVADNITKTRHNSNQELIGQGIGNAFSGLFGGLPGAGATMRTVVNVKSGGRTRLSGAVHALVLLAALLGLGALAAHIPLAVLAGILITVGIGIVDYKGLRHAVVAPKADTSVMVVVLLLTVFVDLMQAVGVGVVMAAILLVKRMNDTFGPTVGPLHQVNEGPSADEVPVALQEQIFVYHLEGPLFFGTSAEFSRSLPEIADHRAIVFDFRDVPFLDQSAAYAMEEALLALNHRQIPAYLSGLREQPSKLLRDLEVIPGCLPEHRVVPHLNDAVARIVEEVPDLGGAPAAL